MRAILRVALAVLLAPSVSLAQELAVTAAWDGWAARGANTELAVHLPAAGADGAARIEVHDALGVRVVSRVVLTRGLRQTVRIAVPASESLSVVAVMPGERSLRAAVPLKFAERPLVAWLVDADRPAPMPESADWRFVPMQAADLPQLGGSYTSMVAIAAPASMLGKLEDAQLLALLEHAGRCGYIHVFGDSDAAVGALRRAAGCGARNLVSTAEPPTEPEWSEGLSQRFVVSDPAPRQMSALPTTRTGLAALLAALLVYALIAALLLTSLRRVRWVLALPLSAALLSAVLLWLWPPRQHLIVWAEAGANDSAARYHAMLSLRGNLPATYELTVPRVLARADFASETGRAQWGWEPSTSSLSNAQLQGSLLTESQLRFRGSFPIPPAAQVERLDELQLRLRNQRAAPLAQAWLLYRGREYRLTDIAAHAQVTVQVDSGVPPSQAPQRLAAQRLGFDEAGVLLPLDLQSLRDGDQRRGTDGWLLVRQNLPVGTL